MDPLEAFRMLDLRVGRITRAEFHEAARKPAYKLWVDFGPQIGLRQSSAQLTDRYTAEALVGRSVVAAVNLGERSVAGFRSEVLVLGVDHETGGVTLLVPDQAEGVPPGRRVY